MKKNKTKQKKPKKQTNKNLPETNGLFKEVWVDFSG